MRCRSPAVVSHTQSLFTHRHSSSSQVALSLACRRQPHSIVVHSQTFVFLRCRSPAVVSHTQSLFTHRHLSSPCAVARLPSSATLNRCSLTDICLPLALSLACRRQPHSIVVHSQTFVFSLRCRSPAVVSHTRSLFTHRHLSSPRAVARLPSSATLDRCSLTDICLLLALSLACRRQPHSIVVHSQTFVFSSRCRSPAVVSYTRSLFTHRHFVFSLRCRSPAVVSHTRSLFTHRHLCLLLALSLACRRQPHSIVVHSQTFVSSPCAVARLPSSATLDRCSLTDICLLLALSLACRRQLHSIVVHSQTFVFSLRCRSPAVVSHTRSLFTHRHLSSPRAVARLPSSATLDRCSLTDICLLLALLLACRRQPHSIVHSQTLVFSCAVARLSSPATLVAHFEYLFRTELLSTCLQSQLSSIVLLITCPSPHCR